MERWEDKGQSLLSNLSNPNKHMLEGEMTSWLTAINVEKVISAWLDVMSVVSISHSSRRTLENLWMRRVRSAVMLNTDWVALHRWHAGDNFFSRSLAISASTVPVYLTLFTPYVSFFFFILMFKCTSQGSIFTAFSAHIRKILEMYNIFLIYLIVFAIEWCNKIGTSRLGTDL